MIAGFFRNLVRVFAASCVLAAVYLNLVIIPEGHLGVLVENTRGLTPPLLTPGYHWNWTRFIPLKWSLFKIDTHPPAMEVRLHEPLRYGRYMEDPEIFSIDIIVKVKYRLSEKSVLFFWDYLNRNLPENPEYIHERVKLLLETYLADVYHREEDVANLGLYFRKYISNEGNFRKDWETIFAEEDVQLSQYDIVRLEIPEAAVYLENIRNIGKIFDARRDATAKKILADAAKYEKKIIDEEDIEKAKKFTEVMKQYPDIIRYYQIEKINPRAKIVIQNEPPVVRPEPPPLNAQETPKTKKKKESPKEPEEPVADEGQIQPIPGQVKKP